MGGGEGSCGRALACARLALIHGRVHVLLFASECLPPGRPSTALPKGETEASKKGIGLASVPSLRLARALFLGVPNLVLGQVR